MTNYAFFDVDQTIYPRYTMADFFTLLVEQNLADKNVLNLGAKILKNYQTGQTSYKQAGNQSVQLLSSSLKNYRVEMIESLARNFYTKDKFRPWVVQVFSLLSQHNFQIILVSGSPEPIVKAIGGSLDVHKYHCALLEIKESKYTGEVTTFLDDEAKKSLILANYNLENSRVLAFGDSTGDIPMLSLGNHSFIYEPHQPEMIELMKDKQNWHTVNDSNIITTTKQMLKDLLQ